MTGLSRYQLALPPDMGLSPGLLLLSFATMLGEMQEPSFPRFSVPGYSGDALVRTVG